MNFLPKKKSVYFKLLSQKEVSVAVFFRKKRTEVSFKPFLLGQVTSFENANHTELLQQINKKLMGMRVTWLMAASVVHILSIDMHTAYVCRRRRLQVVGVCNESERVDSTHQAHGAHDHVVERLRRPEKVADHRP